MQVRILGKKWHFELVDASQLPRDTIGECDAPTKRNKGVRVLKDLRGKEALEVVLHECLHGTSWDQFDEEFVERVASDIAAVAWLPDVLRMILDCEEVQRVLGEMGYVKSSEASRGNPSQKDAEVVASNGHGKAV